MPDGVPLIDPDLVAGRIEKLLADRRSAAVKPLLAALQKLSPDHRDLALLQAAYCSQTGNFGQALQVLEAAIGRSPKNPALVLRRAEILYGQSDYAGAAMDAADAVMLAPNLIRAKSVLGLALMKLQQFDSARLCLEESFAADPTAVDVALALAALAAENAPEILTRAIAGTPSLVVLRNALTRRYLAAGDQANAMRNAARTRAEGTADAESFCLQAFGQMQQGKWEDAGFSIAQAQSLAPYNPWAARLANALGSRAAGRVAPVPQSDALAAEQELLAGCTILPGSFRTLLQETQIPGPVLDLFCGTGLNAIAARDVCAGPWTGVDPDPELLLLCAARGQYQALENRAPENRVPEHATATQYPIILLNEAFGYSASPLPWLGFLRHSLAPGGIALAAIPTGMNGLGGHGLFAHNPDSITSEAAKAGLACRLPRADILRHIQGIPLHGVIAVFQAA